MSVVQQLIAEIESAKRSYVAPCSGPSDASRDQRDRDRMIQRARAYLAKTPPAIEGQGGDQHTFTVCCRIVRGLDLDDHEAFEVLSEWNLTCEPPWTDRELQAKIEGARKYGDEPIGGRIDDCRILPPAAKLPAPTPATSRRDNDIDRRRPVRSADPADDPLTEAGAAERFARLHSDDLRYDHRRGRWLLWQGHRWVPDQDAAITRRALAFTRDWQRRSVEIADRERREATFKAAVRLERRDALVSMLKFAADLRPIADDGEGWDHDPWVLGTPGGVIDLTTGTLRPGRREDKITMATGVTFDPEARSDRWAAALRAILQTD